MGLIRRSTLISKGAQSLTEEAREYRFIYLQSVDLKHF